MNIYTPGELEALVEDFDLGEAAESVWNGSPNRPGTKASNLLVSFSQTCRRGSVATPDVCTRCSQILSKAPS